MESGSKIVSANVSTESSCELAASSSQNSLPSSSSLVCLREEAVPGASLTRRELSQFHIVELKCWLCRAATTVGKKQDLVKRWAGCTNSVIMIYLTNIFNRHPWIWCSVCDYITAGWLHSSCLRAQIANQVSPIPSVLSLERWTSSLQQLLPFNYGCLYAHLVTDSKTIAENQRSTTSTAF